MEGIYDASLSGHGMSGGNLFLENFKSTNKFTSLEIVSTSKDATCEHRSEDGGRGFKPEPTLWRNQVASMMTQTCYDARSELPQVIQTRNKLGMNCGQYLTDGKSMRIGL